ncbi:hypothetical protein [Streptomyces beijiangensis]|uniref:Uncharacterized protein n=1 Tax=Streptomyces beijiangensis TaxID=163361 RepID=A0A939FED2_9ACTN|nr:hypothetical protein [Streptomyces beijiangensis]MBO0517057.1 hypothetical protein [Streptomyces beijiangensis]
MLLTIFAVGLVAQFVKPVGDALQDKTFIGGALFSLVGYVLYDAVKELSASFRTPPEVEATSDDLRLLVAGAFAAREVSICFFGYTGESLFSAVKQQLVWAERDPGSTRKVAIRMLVPDFSRAMTVPSRVGPDGAPEDDRAFRVRLENICIDYAKQLAECAAQLAASHPVEVSCEYRVYQGIPREKVCVFNNRVVLHGRYDITATSKHGGQLLYDPDGLRTDLRIWSSDRLSDGPKVRQWVEVMESEWKLASRTDWQRIE